MGEASGGGDGSRSTPAVPEPDIAADSADRLHVVWTDNTYTGCIYYKRSTDGSQLV
jgi:hypothetical protein